VVLRHARVRAAAGLPSDWLTCTPVCRTRSPQRAPRRGLGVRRQEMWLRERGMWQVTETTRHSRRSAQPPRAAAWLPMSSSRRLLGVAGTSRHALCDAGATSRAGPHSSPLAGRPRPSAQLARPLRRLSSARCLLAASFMASVIPPRWLTLTCPGPTASRLPPAATHTRGNGTCLHPGGWRHRTHDRCCASRRVRCRGAEPRRNLKSWPPPVVHLS
jgi:hypothetical protein